MKGGRSFSQTELEEHLADQLRFLEASAAAFDGGFEGEAKRLAVTLRVLLHDRGQSRSLLGQLDRKKALFWDTAARATPGNAMAEGSLVVMVMSQSAKPKYTAPLDDAPEKGLAPFDKWWNAPVFSAPDGANLSRRELVLTAADQDGGAHVDPALDETYARFSRDNLLGWARHSASGTAALTGATQAAIRQIAHEVLKTLLTGYTRQPDYGPDAVIVSGPSLVEVSPQPFVRARPRVGRNEPCPCGSGKKSKFCHGG